MLRTVGRAVWRFLVGAAAIVVAPVVMVYVFGGIILELVEEQTGRGRK